MITVYWFGADKTFRKDIPLQEVPEHLRREDGILWIDVETPHDEDIRFLGETFHFHPLALKACTQHTRRSTVEIFDAYTFLIVRGADWPAAAKKFTTAQLAVFIGSRYLVTTHDKKLLSVRDALEQCEKTAEQMFSEGTDFILYEILDIMAARYMNALDRLEEEISRVEEEILSGAGPDRRDMEGISLMRWNVLHLKRVVGPLRDTVNQLARGDSPHVTGKAQVYFRNVYDHMLRVAEALDTYREVVTDLRDAHLAMVSNRMNQVIKVLTVITTILLPLTVISGIYGMNFQYMPELKWRFGYYAVLAFMAAMTVVTALLLKRKKWM